MPSAPKSFLFGDYKIVTATAGRSRFGHTFGGPHDRKGASRKDCKGILIHLLHRLDLTDPAIPLSVPGVRWLPFYYCFDFRANDLGYRLISDDKLVAYFPEDDPDVSTHEEWPDDDYPLEFPRSKIRISKFDYDPTSLDDAYHWAGVFGIGKLTKRHQAIAKKRAVKLMELFGGVVPETDEEYREALSLPFLQGRPRGGCLNPKCRKGQLSPIALLPAEPVKGVHTFGEWGTGVRLIFQMCNKCHTIRVCNECT